MSWDSLVDTLLNLGAFAFVGVLLWLYLKKDPTDEASDGD